MKATWLAAALGLCAACSAGHSTGSAAAQPGGESERSALTGPIQIYVRAWMMTGDQSREAPLEPGGRMRSRDFFTYFVRMDKPAYLYVVQFFANGEFKVLFPLDDDLIIPAHLEVRIPIARDEWFRLDESKGTEHVYIITTPLPLSQTEPELSRIVKDPRTSPPSGVLPPPATPRPPVVPQTPLPTSSTIADTPAPTVTSSTPSHSVLGPYDFLKRKEIDTVKLIREGHVVLEGRARHDGVGVIHFSYIHE
jgi:Domain of unknown function (DUF4384)